MVQQAHPDINRLIGVFMDLQETWERDRDALDWEAFETLAREGANAYNEGAGPSFHSLALDGVQHSEFHARFLGSLLNAGFDPFMLVSAGSGRNAVPVIDHADLAQAAGWNPSSAQMRSSLMTLARTRFEPLLQAVESGDASAAFALLDAVKACAESVPDDLLRRIVPELVPPQRKSARRENINPVEAYLSPAEMDVENRGRPYG